MSDSKDTRIRVFVTNLGLYNEGRLVGDWLDLPVRPDELEPWCRAHAAYMAPDDFGQPREELFVSEYELSTVAEDAGLRGVLRQSQSGEFVPLREWNLAAEMLDYLDPDLAEAVSLAVDQTDSTDVMSFLNLVEQADDIPYTPYDAHLGGDTVEESLGLTVGCESGLTHTLEGLGVDRFFDYAGYGRSLSYDCALGADGWLDLAADMPGTNRFTLAELEGEYWQDETEHAGERDATGTRE